MYKLFIDTRRLLTSQRSTLRFSPSTTIDLLCSKTSELSKSYLIVATLIVPHFVLKYKRMQKAVTKEIADEAGDGQKKKEKKNNQAFNK